MAGKARSGGPRWGKTEKHQKRTKGFGARRRGARTRQRPHTPKDVRHHGLGQALRPARFRHLSVRGGCELALGSEALDAARKSSTARHPAGGRGICRGLPLNVVRIATVRDAGIPARRTPRRGRMILAKLLTRATEELRAGRSPPFGRGSALLRDPADVAKQGVGTLFVLVCQGRLYT